MDTLGKILVVVDPTATAQPCVHKAARLAQAFGAELELFICDSSAELRASRFAAAEMYEVAVERKRAAHDGQLEGLAAPLRQRGLKVATDVVFHDPLHAGIVGKLRTARPDLVIKDTHYHSAVRRALFTNTDWHLIRECPPPLLLSKPAAWRPQMKFAAALDPGHADDKPAVLDRELLACAARLALGLQAELRAVHVFNPAPVVASVTPTASIYAGPTYIDTELVKSLREAHQRDFAAVVAEVPACAERADLIEGAPPEALPGYALAHDIDVMVLGAVARGALRRMLVGSTAERLLDRLPCDILVVKPRELVEQMQAAAPAAD
jgi:universal stress protein E